MLMRKNLVFPRLKNLREEKFKSWSDRNKTTDIYSLDWDSKDEHHKRNHEKWLKSYHPDKENIPFLYELPEPYESWIQSLEFAIPRNYLDEIRRTTGYAIIEWGMERGFDTSIREMCLKPAISYVAVAFKLIADCPYDKEKNYFYRGNDKFIIKHALLYRFWLNQTGGGLVRYHAELDKLERSIAFSKERNRWDDHDREAQKFLNKINKFEKIWEKRYDIFQKDCSIGPSIEPEEK